LIAGLAAAVTGPRGRWVTVAVWLGLGIAGFLGRARIDDVTAAGQASFLPANAESTRALDALERSQQSGEEVPTLIVFERNGGLSRADLRAIGRIGRGLDELQIVGATPIVDPFSADAEAPYEDVARHAKGIGPLSLDGEAALVVLALDAADRGAIGEGVRTIRRYLAANAEPGVKAYVTGPGGIAADLEQVADEAGKTLLIATRSWSCRWCCWWSA
jgi:RND superfamily putative drug exporter